MTKKKKKKKRRAGASQKKGGRISGMRDGIKGFVGTGGKRKKESPIVKVLTYIALAAAIAILIYRFTR